MFDKIIDGFVKTFIAEDRYKMFLNGFWNTIQIAFVATVIGVVIGAIVAIIRVFNKQTGKLRLLSLICEIYTTVIRGTPVVVQLLITYNIIFAWSTKAVLIGMIGFGLNSGAYVAEIMRGGINSVDPGQLEAARAVGLPFSTSMIKVVIPQAVKNILPTMGNEFIALIKETAIVGYVGAVDITKAFQDQGSNSYEYMIPYLVMALLYIVIVAAIASLIKLMERRLARSERHS